MPFSDKIVTFAHCNTVPRLYRWHRFKMREESPGSKGRSTSESRSYW